MVTTRSIFHYNAEALSDEREYAKIVSFIDLILHRDVPLYREIANKAQRLKDLIISLEGFIEANTSVVCPQCIRVCCINKHGYYELEDLIYLRTLRQPLPLHDFGLSETSPCQFLRKQGCSLERFIRPFRCNWYFCVPLIEHMQGSRGRDYRDFNSKLQEAIEVRRNLINDFKLASDII